MSFLESAYALSQYDSTVDCGHESASSFTQYVLICALVEIYSLARKSMVSYGTFEGFRTQDSKAFLLREQFAEAFANCMSLWWASPECLWQTSARCHPRLENILLLQYMLASMHGSGTEPQENRREMLPGFAAAAEVFTSCSKVGFSEVCLICFNQHTSYGLTLSTDFPDMS